MSRPNSLAGIEPLPPWAALLAPHWKDVKNILQEAGAPKEWGETEAIILFHAAVIPVAHDQISWTKNPALTLRKLRKCIGWNVELTGVMMNGLHFLHLMAEAPDVVIEALPKIRRTFEKAAALNGGVPSPEILAAQFILANNDPKKPKKHTELLAELKTKFPSHNELPMPFTKKVVEKASHRVRKLHGRIPRTP